MPLMIKLNRNIMKVDLCLDNGHFITVIKYIEEQKDDKSRRIQKGSKTIS